MVLSEAGMGHAAAERRAVCGSKRLETDDYQYL